MNGKGGRGMRFTKMHGIGNDYVFVSLFDEKVAEPDALARAVSDRHLGVGSDGLILIGPSARADASMRVFNADGSEAEMCGNAIRCVAKYCYERGICKKDEMAIETKAGVKALALSVEDDTVVSVRVDMGTPRLKRQDIPMLGPEEERCANERIDVDGRKVMCTCVNMGNPHCVVFVDDVDRASAKELGPKIETHELFPKRTNVHFVQVLERDQVRMVTWERGSGVTLACGTGASAVCVAAAITGRTKRSIVAHLPGGDLELEFQRNDHVCMTGPAAFICDGEWPSGQASRRENAS